MHPGHLRRLLDRPIPLQLPQRHPLHPRQLPPLLLRHLRHLSSQPLTSCSSAAQRPPLRAFVPTCLRAFLPILHSRVAPSPNLPLTSPAHPRLHPHPHHLPSLPPRLPASSSL